MYSDFETNELEINKISMPTSFYQKFRNNMNTFISLTEKLKLIKILFMSCKL